jgi:hypothetical protein
MAFIHMETWRHFASLDIPPRMTVMANLRPRLRFGVVVSQRADQQTNVFGNGYPGTDRTLLADVRLLVMGRQCLIRKLFVLCHCIRKPGVLFCQ